MEDEKREQRCVSLPVILRAAEDGQESRTIEGYAAVFDSMADRLDFEEIIERGAFDDVLEDSDVLALLNHNMSRGILARWNKECKSLQLSIDAKGLRYSFDAPRTALGDELLENVRRGEIRESSFAFTVKEDTWEKKDDGTWKRTIHKIKRIYDVSPVYTAAYSATSVYTRGRDAAQAEIDRRNSQMPESYYEELNKNYNL